MIDNSDGKFREEKFNPESIAELVGDLRSQMTALSVTEDTLVEMEKFLNDHPIYGSALFRNSRNIAEMLAKSGHLLRRWEIVVDRRNGISVTSLHFLAVVGAAKYFPGLFADLHASSRAAHHVKVRASAESEEDGLILADAIANWAGLAVALEGPDSPLLDYFREMDIRGGDAVDEIKGKLWPSGS